MALASNPDNIRFNGTGRSYFGAVGGTSFDDFGELDKMAFSMKVTTESLKSTRNAAKATILEADKDREASLTFGLREMTMANLAMALLGAAINTANQAASYVYQTTKAWVADLYIDTGHLNVFSTKLSHGTVTNGPFTIGLTVTGGTSATTGQIAFVGTGFVEVVHVTGGTGVFVAGEVITSTTISATLSGVEVLDDVVIVSTAGATRRVQGTDYTLDPDYGYIRRISTGGVLDTDKLSYDYAAVSKQYIWGMSAGSVEKKLIFVADKDDLGPRQRWTFHRCKISLNGDFPLLGEGAQVLQITATVLADTTQASGQEYYKTEVM